MELEGGVRWWFFEGVLLDTEARDTVISGREPDDERLMLELLRLMELWLGTTEREVEREGGGVI